MGSSKPITIALLGAGARGELNLGTLARRHPDRLKFVAVAEPHEARRERFVEAVGIPRDQAFTDWRELVERPRLADAVVNALPCTMHYHSTLAALRAGYHVFLEKPMAHTPGECVHLTRAARALDRVLLIALQSRYNDIYTRVRELADREIGDLLAINCEENIAYWHFVLSYVRGIHRRSDESHSFVLAKGIHDLDLVSWFAGAPAARVASFGRRSFFGPDNAPPGAPERCLDGCPVEADCEFSAIQQYVDPGRPDIPWRLLTGSSARAAVDVIREPRFRTLASVLTHDLSREGRLKVLEETPYGACVFHADNDVVDHQSVSVEFEGGATATFSLNAFSVAWERTLDLHGTRGEVRSADFSGRLELRRYRPARVRRWRVPYHGIIHGGGDEKILLAFADAVRRGTGGPEPLTSATRCLESHLLCFAAERARVNGEVVAMDALRREADEEADRLEATAAG